MAHWESLPLLLVGLCVAALGLVALAVDPRGKPNRLFAAFLLLVAGNFAANWIAYAYADSLQDAALGIVSNPWYWVSHSLNLLDAAALLWFASAYPYPSAWERRARVRAAVACVLLAHVAYVLLDPVEASRGPMEAQTGRVVWIGLAEMALFVAAYLGALGLAVRSLVEAEFASTREVARPLVAGLLVAVSTRAGLVESDLRLFEHAGTAGSLVVRLGVTWLVFGAALLLLRREPADSRPATRPWIVAAAAMVGGVSAVWVLSALPTTPAQRLLASSLLYACRWVFFGAVVTYALARHAFLGAGPRMLAPLRSAQVLLVAAAVFVLLRLFLAPLEGHAPGGPSAGDALALGAACLFAVGLVARRGATARLPAGGDDALRARKLDAYRALVEASLEAGGRGEEPGLAAHRRRLGLTAQDHEDVVALALAERDAGESRGPRGALPPGYALEEVFPSGATAWTLLARDPGGRRVVVKTLRAEWRRHPRVAAAFLREGRILSAVRHPNVVRVLGVLDHPPALLLEPAEGGALARRVQDAGPLDGAALRRLAHDLLAGLAAVHGAGAVHRDIKPENVLLAGDGRAMVADCGAAREAAQGRTRVRITAPGEEVGTVLYMAPEQVRGQGADARSDLHAAAAVLVFAATGRHYLRAEGLGEFDAKRRIVEEEPQLPADLPPDVARLVAACLRKTPRERPASAQAALALLRG